MEIVSIDKIQISSSINENGIETKRVNAEIYAISSGVDILLSTFDFQVLADLYDLTEEDRTFLERLIDRGEEVNITKSTLRNTVNDENMKRAYYLFARIPIPKICYGKLSTDKYRNAIRDAPAEFHNCLYLHGYLKYYNGTMYETPVFKLSEISKKKINWTAEGNCLLKEISNLI